MSSLFFTPWPNYSASEEDHTVEEATDDTVHAPHGLRLTREPSEASFGMRSDVVIAVSYPGPSANRRHPKKCRFKGCSKGARGTSGLCITHGSGQRCQKPGCHKGAEIHTRIARPMAAAPGANSWGTPRALRARRTTASPTVAGGGAATPGARRPCATTPGGASSTEGKDSGITSGGLGAKSPPLHLHLRRPPATMCRRSR
jgi:hypothetical protein